MKNSISKNAELLLRVFNKFNENQKSPRNYGIAELLYPAEIHMVMNIGDHPGIHMAELARIAGVTRGAVSQLVTKLENKGLVVKKTDPQNNLKTLPMLTTKGKIAYYAHEQHHEEINREMYDFFQSLSEDNFAAIEQFLCHLEAMADRLK